MAIGIHFDDDDEYDALKEYETNITRKNGIDPTTDPLTYAIYNDY